jgi:hypothetical protein
LNVPELFSGKLIVTPCLTPSYNYTPGPGYSIQQEYITCHGHARYRRCSLSNATTGIAGWGKWRKVLEVSSQVTPTAVHNVHGTIFCDVYNEQVLVIKPNFSDPATTDRSVVCRIILGHYTVSDKTPNYIWVAGAWHLLKGYGGNYIKLKPTESLKAYDGKEVIAFPPTRTAIVPVKTLVQCGVYKPSDFSYVDICIGDGHNDFSEIYEANGTFELVIHGLAGGNLPIKFPTTIRTNEFMFGSQAMSTGEKYTHFLGIDNNYLYYFQITAGCKVEGNHGMNLTLHRYDLEDNDDESISVTCTKIDAYKKVQ